MSEEKTTIIFRIERDLKEAFDELAKSTERTTSQYLRAFIKDQVRKYREQTTAIAPQAIKTPPTTQTTPTDQKTPPRLRKGEKLNRMPPRKEKK